MTNKQMIMVSGLPRSGSTLMCELLGSHPLIHNPRHSSPLLNAILAIRCQLSDNPFYLSQLDQDFEKAYAKLLNGCRSFVDGWYLEVESSLIVDKNRGWLHHLELTKHLFPDFKMIVCIRELGQVFASIERQHQKAPLIDFADKIGGKLKQDRVDCLFAQEGVVGGPLRSIESLVNINENLQQHLFYAPYEQLCNYPIETMNRIWEWLQVKPYPLTFDNLYSEHVESDSYYRYKYPHKLKKRVEPVVIHEVPVKIQSYLESTFSWYYDLFYFKPREKQNEIN